MHKCTYTHQATHQATPCPPCGWKPRRGEQGQTQSAPVLIPVRARGRQLRDMVKRARRKKRSKSIRMACVRVLFHVSKLDCGCGFVLSTHLRQTACPSPGLCQQQHCPGACRELRGQKQSIWHPLASLAAPQCAMPIG